MVVTETTMCLAVLTARAWRNVNVLVPAPVFAVTGATLIALLAIFVRPRLEAEARIPFAVTLIMSCPAIGSYYAGIGGFVRDRNLALLGRIVNAERSAVHGELLSYLFLACEFIDELIALGRRDAERWLDAPHDDGLWQIGRLPASTGESAPAEARRRS